MTRLNDLWEEHDKLWENFLEIPVEEVNSKNPSERVKHYYECSNAIYDEIESLPQRDFVDDLRSAYDHKIDKNDALKIYGSIANVTWRHEGGSRFSCTWRYAGDIAADLYQEGGVEDDRYKYMEFYCSGNEGTVDEEVEKTMSNFGWEPID